MSVALLCPIAFLAVLGFGTTIQHLDYSRLVTDHSYERLVADQFCLASGALLSIVFPIFVCLNPKLAFALWARIASVFACVFGIAWVLLSFRLSYAFISDLNYDFYGAYCLKGLFGGICIGLVFCIIVARPYAGRVA